MAIKNRNPIVGVILSIVTCGIYGLYWRWCMAKEAQSVIGEENMLEAILVTLPITAFIGYFLTEKKYAAACEEKGIEHKENAILYLILGLFIVPVVDYLFQSELNKLAPVEE